MDPSPAMSGDFVSRLDKGLGKIGMALERHGDAEYRERQGSPFELAQDAPDAGTRAILVHRFHAQVPSRIRFGADDFRTEALGLRIALQDRALATFLIIEHELHSQFRAVRPTRVHRITAVADEIARVARDVQGDLCRQLGRIPRIWPRSASRFS